MLTTFKSFNGNTFNSDFQVVLLNPHSANAAKPVYIEQADNDALSSGLFTVDVQNKTLSVRIKNYANRNALKQQIKQTFKRGTKGDLVVTFNDEGVDYQLTCTVLQALPSPDDPLVWLITLQTSTSAWRSVSAETLSPWVVTSTGDSLDIDVEGYEDTFLSLQMTATSGPASGYLKQNILRVVNPTAVELGRIGYCITINTQALVTAGYMQADCDDLRIVNLRTGQELKRWIFSPNTTATKVWVVLDFKKGVALPLNQTIASSGDIAYLQFKVTNDVKGWIGKMEKSGIVYHGNEWFAYSNTDAVNCRLTVSKRGLFGTTLSSHAVNDTFYYIQHPLLMKYGNSSATNPATDDETYDDEKPLINMSSSSNTQWIWDATHPFYDPDHPNRACGWKFSRTATGPNSKVFYVDQDAESGDAAIGFKVASYKVGTTWKSETVLFVASFEHKGYLGSTVSMTGEKYRSNANWISGNAILRRGTGTTRVTLWTELKPTAQGSWESWTHNSVAIAANTSILELIFSGGYTGADSAYAAFQALTCTVDIGSTNVPSATFLGATDSYPLDIAISNDATRSNGDDVTDAIALSYPMLLNKDFVINGEARSASYDNVNAHSAIILDDESRAAFIRLVAGVTNTITIAGSDVGSLSVVPSYYRRRL